MAPSFSKTFKGAPMPSKALYLASLIVGVCALTKPLMSQEAWSPSCEGNRCTVSRSAINTENHQRIATLIVVLDIEEPTVIGAVLPLGVALEPGLRLLAGSEELEVPLQVCYPDGCRGFLPVDDVVLSRIAAEAEIDVRFFPYSDDRPASVTIPLDGLSNAIQAAREQLSAD